MTRSVDETRREFLLRMAKASAFVPPAIATLSVGRLAGQKGSSSGAGTGGGTGGGTGVTGLSGSSSAMIQSDRDALRDAGQVQGPSSTTTRGGSVPGGVQAPWQRPPPTTSGG